MLMPKRAAVAWAAGLFEGEGSFFYQQPGRVGLRLSMCDRDVVERFQRVLAAGGVYYRPARPDKNQREMWEFMVSGPAAIRITRLVLPYLGQRRTETALKVLQSREEYVRRTTAARSCRNCGETFSPKPGRQAARRAFCTKRCCDRYHGRRHYRRHAGLPLAEVAR
jgi:hypothetical protein